MALDPSIALAVRPPAIPIPQIQTPIEQFGQILTLRNLMTQGQLGQIGLQSKQLELDQLRREMQERQALADYFSRTFGGGTTPAGSGAAAAPAQAAPDQAPAFDPIGGPQSVPGLPNVGALPSAPPAVIPAATPVAPAVPAAQDGTGPGGFNYGDILRIAPMTGMGVVKGLTEYQKNQSEAQIKQYEANAKKAEGLGRIAQSIQNAKDPQAAFAPGVMQAVSEGWMTPEHGRAAMAHGYDPATLQSFIDQSQTSKEFHENQKTDLESLGTAQKNAAATIGSVSDQPSYDQWLSQQDRRIQAQLGRVYHPGLNTAVESWAIPAGDRYEKSMQKTAQDAQLLTDPKQIPDFIAAQPAERRAYLQKLSQTVPLDKFKELLGVAAVAPKPGETVPLPAGVETQKVEQAAAQGLGAAQATIRAKEIENTALAGSVIRDPALYSKLSPEKQSELQPFLARLGFTQFTIKPSDTELTTLYNNQRNLDAVKMMRDDFKSGKYDKITGPILGHAKEIPWLGDNGKILEGKLDELRSTLGDLVKGGTLRSSDIPIYEKMFPNVTDTTDVIKGKLNSLYDRLESDVTRYRSVLKSSGRALPDEAAPPAPTGPPASAVPAAVRQALSGVGQGIHKLSDGSWWVVNRDGSIEAAKAPAK